MSPGQSLSIGLVAEGTVYDEVVIELLEHQGVCYETIEPGTPFKSYPLVLVSKSSAKALREALDHCQGSESVVVVEEILDLEMMLRCLSGTVENDGDDLDVPVNVAESRLLGVVRERLSALGLPLVVKAFWPHGEAACLVVTQDVDWLHYSPFHKVVFSGPMNFLRKAYLGILGLTGKDFGWNLEFLTKPRRGMKVDSTFFLRTDYQRDSDLAKDALRQIKESGSELAIHAAHDSHLTEDNLRSELEAFRVRTGNPPKGLRYHILKFRVPDTWIIEAKCGLEYDATFGRNKFFGFRSGVCYPYHPIADKRLDILELPSSFMDWTALHRRLRGGKVIEVVSGITGIVEKFGGVLVVNFHNTYLNRATFPDMVDALEWILNNANGRYWIASAQMCAKWWRDRQAADPKPRLTDEGIVEWEGEIQMSIYGEGARTTITHSVGA